MDKDDIKKAFYEVFPNGNIIVNEEILAGSLFIYCFVQNKDTWKDGICFNDPLNYMVTMNENYTEDVASLLVTPTNHNYYELVDFRKQIINNPDAKKLKQRFERLYAFIKKNMYRIPYEVEL